MEIEFASYTIHSSPGYNAAVFSIVPELYNHRRYLTVALRKEKVLLGSNSAVSYREREALLADLSPPQASVP